MDLVADLAKTYSHDEIRVSHEQNLVLAHVRQKDLLALWQKLEAAQLGTANYGLITDIIACPGLDYCDLANARSISIAQAISNRFAALEKQREIGELKLKISGCINACGHHHVGHIGILGLDRAGVENYQITLGGTGDETCSMGTLTGPGFSSEEVVDAVERIVDAYLELRAEPEEDFLTAYRRLGMQPFKDALYETSKGADI
jgi:sulfite reductase (NADPH) hemoprotein beta-component